MNYLNKSTGKQDQYAAVFGGFHTMNINKKGKVDITKIDQTKIDMNSFKNNILLYYTNIFRSSEKVLSSQKKYFRK